MLAYPILRIRIELDSQMSQFFGVTLNGKFPQMMGPDARGGGCFWMRLGDFSASPSIGDVSYLD